MFLRRNRRKAGGESYEYWTLVESYRTERGPRQRVVATLGKLPGLDKQEQHGWEEIEWLLEGKVPPRQPDLGEAAGGRAGRACWAQVDLSAVRGQSAFEIFQLLYRYIHLRLFFRVVLAFHRLCITSCVTRGKESGLQV